MPTIPGYDIHEQIYEGTHALIYRARRNADALPVILKILRGAYPQPGEVARFRREYEMTRSLMDLDGVIHIYGLEPYKNSLLMVMEDLGGESLAYFLSDRSFALTEFLRIAIRIAGILGAIHHRNIMHKDINPSNLIWNPETDELKLIDFGIATELPREQPEIRNPNVLEGTLAYMSPEQTGRMNRAIDYRTDLYSLGATLYHLLTGRVPFQAEDAMEVVHCHLAQMPDPPCDLPHPAPLPEGEGVLRPSIGGTVSQILSDIIMKLLAKNAEDRYQNACGVKYDLEQCLANLTDRRDLSGFTPGQQDVSDLFRIPQKLYGRAQEISTLLAAFDRIAAPQSQMLLIAGYAGIGKTALVQEMYRPITAKHGYFVAGKFDQLKRNIPYSAIIQAFQNLVRQRLTEPETRLSAWKENLRKAVGPNGQLIIEVIPDVELIIGAQPAVPEIPPNQAQHRFNYVFQNFARVCASVDHPLVIFLDDLQWADSSSLATLDLFLTDPNMRYLLIVGAYRDNEVSEAHPLMLTLSAIQKSGAAIKTISLKPLTQAHANQLLAETFHTPPDVCASLSALVLQKTGGNPFFLRQFLQALYAEQLLEFDPNTGGWRWDLAAIQQADITANVIDLMTGKIQRLPENTQHVLKLAACIGNPFDLPTLAIVHEKSPQETAADLWDSLQEGLVLPLDDNYTYLRMAENLPVSGGQLPVATFQFLHDRVQQAAHALIDEASRQRIHLKIGRLLLANLPEIERDETIFTIVNHLNLGKDLSGDQAEQGKWAKLNLTAGRKAKAAAAYRAAFNYFQVGIDLLPEARWQRQYDLALALHVEAAEAACLSGEFEQMEQLAQLVLQHARTLLDKVKIYEVKILACIAQNNPLEAVQIALPLLKLLGVALPERPGKLDVIHALCSVKWSLIGKRIADFMALPALTDPFKLAAIRIMLRIIPAVQVTNPELFLVLLCKFARFSQHGTTPAAAYGYAVYGYILTEFIGDYSAGYRWGQLARKALEQFDARDIKARTVFTINGFINPWKEHLKETLPPLLEAYQTGLETGDLAYATVSAMSYFFHAYFCGKALAELEREMAAYSDVISQLKQKTVYQYHEIQRQAILNLARPTEGSVPWRLVGEAYDEAQMLPHHRHTNDRAALVLLYFHKFSLAYLFQAYSQAAENAALMEEHLNTAPGSIAGYYYFYGALLYLAMLPDAPTIEHKRLLRKVIAHQKKITIRAQHAPMNYRHKWYLVEAERMRVLGKYADAMDDYDQAIALARTHEYLNDEALAHELAARFYLGRGKIRIAQAYLRDARYCYLKWGALAKVQDLDQRYPELLSQDVSDDRRLDHAMPLTVMGTRTIETGTGVLDLAAAIKASQAISGELVLEHLLTRLMAIVIEQAGAEKGAILFQENGAWIVKAEHDAASDRCQKSGQPEFPRTIVTYVARTKEGVVLADAGQEGQFIHDPYIATEHPRSILCIPLINQGKLLGILYLENRLATGVFTAERLDLLYLLASQAAIALENALLYSTLEQKVHTRTDELEQAKTIAENAQQAAETANQAKSEFLSKISHELRTPLNAILGYTQLFRRDENLTDKQHEMVATIHRSGEQLLLLITDLLDLSKIEARKIDLHPKDFPLLQFLKNLADNIRIRAIKKGITLVTEISPDVPAAVYGDELRLRQILMNLLNNAIKFTEQGSVTLRVTRTWEKNGVLEDWKIGEENVGNLAVPRPPNTSVPQHSNTPTLQRSNTPIFRFEVEDTGIGIPPEHLQYIFLPFYQVNGVRTREEGSGLGLAISQQLARLMSSELRVQSVLGQGTRFWFDLELPEVEGGVVSESPEFEHPLGYTGNRRTLLLVDDNDENRILLRNALAPLGFNLLEAINGYEALEAAKKYHPDLILMDLHMPVLDGFEATRQIRALETGNAQRENAGSDSRFPGSGFTAPIIIGVSASVSIQEQQKSLDAGCKDFLAKPIQMEHLLECLHRHLKLEWIFAEAGRLKPDQQLHTRESLGHIPSRAVLAELSAYAEGGYITDLHQALARLKASEPVYIPFVTEIEQWANNLQFERIIALITSLSEP